MFESERFLDPFLCSCCGRGRENVSTLLLKRLLALEVELDRDIIIHSAYRCPKHNAKLGGKPDSQHLIGRAADFHVDKLRSWGDLLAIRAAMLKLGFHGIGLYENGGNGWVHGDVRLLAVNEHPHLWEEHT